MTTKPVQIEARQLAGEDADMMGVCDWVAASGYPWLLGNALEPETLAPYDGTNRDPGIYLNPATGELMIRTRTRGELRAERGDWIILDANDEIQVSKSTPVMYDLHTFRATQGAAPKPAPLPEADDPRLSRLHSLIVGAELGIEVAHRQNLHDHGQGDYMRGFRDCLGAVLEFIEEGGDTLHAARAYYADDCARPRGHEEPGGHTCTEACENRDVHDPTEKP